MSCASIHDRGAQWAHSTRKVFERATPEVRLAKAARKAAEDAFQRLKPAAPPEPHGAWARGPPRGGAKANKLAKEVTDLRAEVQRLRASGKKAEGDGCDAKGEDADDVDDGEFFRNQPRGREHGHQSIGVRLSMFFSVFIGMRREAERFEE